MRALFVCLALAALTALTLTPAVTFAQPMELNCNDGVDNDGDGLVDCEDPDCAIHPECPGFFMEICDDGIDNDGDGLVDCEDPDCDGDPACPEPVPATSPLGLVLIIGLLGLAMALHRRLGAA